jgi:tetrahydromethanopterin S-methyltransferase subunit G
MSVGEILSESWALYTRFFWRLVATAAVVFVALDLIGAILYSLARNSAVGGLFFGLLSVLVTLVGSFWVQGALVEAVQDVRDGKIDSTIGELYSRVGPRLPALIAAGVLAAIGIVIGLILFIVPGLFLLTRWCLIVPAIVLEEKSAGDSFGRSNELVKGASWPVFGVIIVTGLMSGIASLLIKGIFSAIFNPFFSTWIGGLIANSIVVPFVAAAWTLMYFKRAEAASPAAPAAPAEA